MSPAAAKVQSASVARIELEVAIDAPPEAVWRAIVEEPDAWWISDLRCVPGRSTVSLDARAGGTMIESNDEGGSLLWFTVIAVEPGKSINLAGAIAPPFGGPASAFLHIEVRERDGGSTVAMTNSMHGLVDEQVLPQIEGGWRLLLENGIKRHVETGARA